MLNSAALADLYQKLRATAKIEVLSKPGEGEGQSAETPKQKGVAGLFEKMMPGWSQSGKAQGGMKKDDDSDKTETKFEIVRRKAKQGEPESIYLLGSYAERGIGHEYQGMETAIELYQKAAKKGSLQACIRLAELYRVGRGVPKDPDKALEWNAKAINLSSKPYE